MWLAPLAKLFCISCYDLPLPSSFVIHPSSFLSFSVITFPFEDSQRQLGMCTAIAEYVRRGRFVSFSSLSPFGGSGAYQISNSLHSPSLRKSARAEYVIGRGYPFGGGRGRFLINKLTQLTIPSTDSFHCSGLCTFCSNCFT